MQEGLPQKTIRDLVELVAYFTERALAKLKQMIQALGPFVGPPEDMEVRTRDGAEYTGVVVLESNEVTGGIVARTGQSLPHYSPPSLDRVWPRPEPRSQSGLTHWANDPRDDEEDPWKR
jgi:hypothetical protein